MGRGPGAGRVLTSKAGEASMRTGQPWAKGRFSLEFCVLTGTEVQWGLWGPGGGWVCGEPEGSTPVRGHLPSEGGRRNPGGAGPSCGQELKC